MVEFYIIVKLQSLERTEETLEGGRGPPQAVAPLEEERRNCSQFKSGWSEGVRKGDMLNVFLVLIRNITPTTLHMQ